MRRLPSWRNRSSGQETDVPVSLASRPCLPPTTVLLFWAGIGSGAVHRTGIGTLPPWQVKMREEAVAKAAQEWEGERERMAKEARALRQKLDASASQNKQLVTDKNILQVRPCMHAGGGGGGGGGDDAR